MAKAVKSICKLSLPLRVYGPMRLTHKHSLMMVLGGRSVLIFLALVVVGSTGLAGHVVVWMVVCIPFQCIMVLIITCVCPGCLMVIPHLSARIWSGLGITTQPSLHTQVMFQLA